MTKAQPSPPNQAASEIPSARKRRRHGSWLYLLAAISLALVLWIGWKTDEDVFPYVGVWSGTHQFPGHSAATILTIEFTKDGECYVTVNGTTRPNTYQMESNYAFVTGQVAPQGIKEGRVGYLAATRKATPIQGGEVLRFDPLQVFWVDHETGERFLSRPRDPSKPPHKWVLHRVK